MNGSMEIEIDCPVGGEHAAFLREKLAAVAELLDGRPDLLSVAVVGDAMMSDLHRRFLNVDGPTDVLTFEHARDEDDGRVTEGEVVVCLDEAARQCEGRSHGVREELLLYCVHGLLHLSGYDDSTPPGHAAMHAREDELLRAVGVGAVFTNGSRNKARP